MAKAIYKNENAFAAVEDLCGHETFVTVFPTEEKANKYFEDVCKTNLKEDKTKVDVNGDNLETILKEKSAEFSGGTIKISHCELYRYDDGEIVIHFC